MKKRYLVIDVETPNHNNDRISAIAVSSIVNGEIQGQRYYLVNPEAEFDTFNVRLTGITPEAVANAPTFPEVWEQIREDFSNSVIVAHNAPFDLSVLEKVCKAYDLPFAPPTYIDTVQMSRCALPDLDHHRLNDVCAALSLGLEHHRADSDCAACAEAFLHCIRTGLEPDEFERVFRQGTERSTRQTSARDLIRQAERCEETTAFLHVHGYDGPVFLEGAVVCLSGAFVGVSKSELTALLEKKGAIVKKSVLKSLDYLFVGSQGNAQWSSGTYGTKIKKAIELQESGADVKIVTESVLLEALESAPDAEAPIPKPTSSQKAPANKKEIEASIFQELLPTLEAVAKRSFLPAGGIKLTPGNSYSSVFAHGILVCRICWRKSKYISIKGEPEQYQKLSPIAFEQKTTYGNFLNIPLKDHSEIASLLPLMEQVMQDMMNQIPKDFDCCSRFEECSAARACIHPNPEFAKQCGYRKKLANGIVFTAGKE